MPAEQNLLRQLQNADATAFRRIYEKYAPRVYQFALGYLKTSRDAEQIVRDVFVQLWEKRHTLNDTLPLNGYLFTLTYNLMLSAFRQLHLQYQFEELQLRTESGVEIQEHQLYQELEQVYQRAVAQLSPRQREIYLLSHTGGMPTNHIANRLRLSPRAVEEQLNQAYASLSDYFEQCTR